jgi:hypothetical protein
LVVSDPTHSGISPYDILGLSGGPIGDVAAANTLLTPFDLAFSNDYLYDLVTNEGNFRNVVFRHFGSNALAQGLGSVVLYGARSVSTTSGTPLLQGDTQTFSSLTDGPGGWAAAALSQDGRVLALGDLTILAPPYDQVADNGILVARLADFLISAQRSHTLADFPYVFRQSVAYLQPGTNSVTADDLKAIGDLQAWLRSIGRDLSLPHTAPSGEDLIFAGLYTPADELLPYLEPFDLTLPGDSPDGTLTVPGLGTISPTGTGMVLLRYEGAQATLLLLAETSDDLRLLESNLASSGLSGCLTQENAAVCQLGPGGQTRSPNYGSPDLFPDEWMTPEVPPSILLPTPTPMTP